MRRLVIAVLLLAAAGGVAQAQSHLGRPVVDVRVEIAGVVTADPAIVELIETRIGEPLTMIAVRSTIDHLVGLGRFEDVRVFAAPSDQGVVVSWRLTPVRRITTVEVRGDAQVSAAAIRAELVERFGAAPSATRVPDMVGALEAFFADRGFRQAAIVPRLEERASQPERSRSARR